MVCHSISFNIDEVLYINPYANVFVCGDFNIHHQDWLNYSGGIDESGELFYNFSISNDLTEIVNFPTRIPDCDSHSPALSSVSSICYAMAFPPLRNSDHVVAAVSIDSPSYSQWDAPFHRITYAVFLTQILSSRQKNADAKVVLSISRRQKWNSHRQISKNCIFPKCVVNRLPPFKNLPGHTNIFLMG